MTSDHNCQQILHLPGTVDSLIPVFSERLGSPQIVGRTLWRWTSRALLACSLASFLLFPTLSTDTEPRVARTTNSGAWLGPCSSTDRDKIKVLHLQIEIVILLLLTYTLTRNLTPIYCPSFCLVKLNFLFQFLYLQLCVTFISWVRCLIFSWL